MPAPAPVYLDHAATTPLRPEARAAMLDGFAMWANPSSPHAAGRRARAALEDARERVKAALKWDGEVIFTSGASEALAIGLGHAQVDRRIVTEVEHDSVVRAAPDAARLPLSRGDTDGAGTADLGIAAEMLAQPGRSIIAVQHINSETGTVLLSDGANPLIGLARDAGALVISDCSQSAGKLPLPDVDLAVVSAHKLGGPIGIGALLVRDFAMLKPTGGQERGYRGGTENLPAALGFAAALEAGGMESWETTAEQQLDFKNLLWRHGEVISLGWQCSHLFSISHRSLSAASLLIRLDAMGFQVSAGSACSSGSMKPSPVMAAFGIDEQRASRAIRLSIGWNTTASDLDAFATAWRDLSTSSPAGPP